MEVELFLVLLAAFTLFVLFVPKYGSLTSLYVRNEARLPQCVNRHACPVPSRETIIMITTFVSIVVVLTYEYFIFAFADSFWAKQPIVLVFPVELLALAWYLCMVFVRLVNLKIVFMEFLGFWSAIGGIVVAEQLMGRYSMSILAPLIVTFFTIALHAVELPYFGNQRQNARFIPQVKVLFSIQLIVAAVFLALLVTGNVKRSLEETVEHMAAMLDRQAAMLDRQAAMLDRQAVTQERQATALDNLTSLINVIINHFGINETTATATASAE